LFFDRILEFLKELVLFIQGARSNCETANGVFAAIHAGSRFRSRCVRSTAS
jgi:hypothetical protein